MNEHPSGNYPFRDRLVDFWRSCTTFDAFCLGGIAIVGIAYLLASIGAYGWLAEVIFWAGRG